MAAFGGRMDHLLGNRIYVSATAQVLAGNGRLDAGVHESIDKSKDCAFMAYAGFAKELPQDSERIKTSDLQKMSSLTEDWVDRQIILTSNELLVAKIGKNVASETIKLHLVDKVTVISKAMQVTRAMQSDSLTGTGVMAGQDMFAFQVFMTEDAGKGDCSYSFRTTSQKECREWEKATEAAVDAAKRLHEYALHPENGVLARIALRCKYVYKSHYCKLFLSFVIMGNFFLNLAVAQENPKAGSKREKYVNDLDDLFVYFFLLEMLFCIFIWGRHFFHSLWRCFDFIVILVSAYFTLSDSGKWQVLRLIRVFRIFRSFSMLTSFRLIFNALSMAIFPVLSAFVILIIIMAIFAVMAVDLFSARDPDNFGDLSRALFSVFRVATGDSWSELARDEMLLYDAFVRRTGAGEADRQQDLQTSDGFHVSIGFFFVCIQMVCGLVLTNVVVAVLLDEFIKAVEHEKKILAQAALDDVSHAFDHKGPLDRLLAPLTHFNDLEDLRHKISVLFHFFDTNDSGLLTKVEVINGLQNSSGIILSDEDCDDIGLNDQENYGGEVTQTSIHHEGLVKRRDQQSPDYQEQYFVLNGSFIEYYANEETYRKGKKSSKITAPLENVKISSGSREGLDYTKDGYHFTLSSLSDGDVSECACKSAIARNKWVRMISDAVTSLEGSNTLSEECFINLIESQLKVYVQRRIARAMLEAEIAASSENNAVLFILKHLVSAMEKLTNGQGRIQEDLSGGRDNWSSSQRIDAIEGKIDKIDNRIKTDNQAMNQKIDTLLRFMARKHAVHTQHDAVPPSPVALDATSTFLLASPGNRHFFGLTLPPLPWGNADRASSKPARAAKTIPLTVPMSAYLPVDYNPDSMRASSRSSPSLTADTDVISRRHTHPTAKDKKMPATNARVISMGVGVLPKGM